MLKISVIIAVYNSHEIVRRQLLHFKNLGLPLELLIVDDNSTPPIKGAHLRTKNKMAWTQGLARNFGARHAKGEYLFFTDIDHILSENALIDAFNFTGNKMIFRRQIAVLDKNGVITQDRGVLKEWGWDNDNLDASVHGNTFLIRKDIFDELGGYDKGIVGYHPAHKGGEDVYFNKKWNNKYNKEDLSVGRDIYMFPLGRFNKWGDLNPFGLFHDLSQTKQEKFYK